MLGLYFLVTGALKDTYLASSSAGPPARHNRNTPCKNNNNNNNNENKNNRTRARSVIFFFFLFQPRSTTTPTVNAAEKLSLLVIAVE